MKSYHELFAEKPLRIVTRQSKLAMAQTDIVTAQLPQIPVEVTAMSTSGDEILDRPLVEIGGKGVFIKALEHMMVQGQADAAVHSFKDMETVLAPDTSLCAVLPRADWRDALVGPYKSIESLPEGAVIGTSSVRRSAILRHSRPDLKVELLRGNVQRRLEKLDQGAFDAIILAMAGLTRLGLEERGHPLDDKVMMPSASQGVIAVQIATSDVNRAEAMRAVFAPLHCKKTEIVTMAERSLLAHLDGSCRTPIGAMGTLQDDGMVRLRAVVLSADGAQKFEAEATASQEQAAALGIQVADMLLSQCGGRSFLA
ncbi:MAG: hydroxymethylbilane synthase [Candidatus Puniceispirillaceae bacterium]